MYKIISYLSSIIRMFYLTNPFQELKYGFIINIAIEPVLYTITFLTVGLFYKYETAPSIGSCLYLLFYCINVGLIKLWVSLGASLIIGMVILAVYVSIILIIARKMNRFIF